MLWRLIYALIALVIVWLLLSLVALPFAHIIMVLAVVLALVYVVLGDRFPQRP